MLIGPHFPKSHIRHSQRNRASRALARALVGLILLALTAQAGTSASGCAPGWRQLFDFQVGDVFQVRDFHENFPLGEHPNLETLRKYRVISRRDSGASRTYVFGGWEKRTQSYYGSANPVQVDTARYSETRIYRDTANDPFEGCSGSLVPMPHTGPHDQLYTQVETHTGDTAVFPLARAGLRMKTYGRRLGEMRDTSVAWLVDVDLLETYAEGLGMVSAFYGGYDAASTSYSLVGYVKGGDTVGVVSPDSNFWYPIALNPPEAHRMGSVRNAMGTRQSAYDAQGRLAPPMGMRRNPSATARFGK